MSKNLSFENSINENKNEEFFAFIKDYNSLVNKEENYNGDKSMVIFSSVLLVILEVLMYYSLNESTSKDMILFGMFFMYVCCFGKIMLEVFSGFLNTKQRKKDIGFIKEKAQGWIEYFKEKENRLILARSLIIRLENIERVKFETFSKENIDKSIKLKKEDVYHLVNYELNESDFYSIELLVTEINNIEHNTFSLFKQEKDLKQIKSEIHNGITNNISNSFKDNKKTTSFH